MKRRYHDQLDQNEPTPNLLADRKRNGNVRTSEYWPQMSDDSQKLRSRHPYRPEAFACQHDPSECYEHRQIDHEGADFSVMPRVDGSTLGKTGKDRACQDDCRDNTEYAVPLPECKNGASRKKNGKRYGYDHGPDNFSI